jgi:hypothetical protein
MAEPVFQLKVFKKDDMKTAVATGETTGTAIAKLAAGTVVNADDYVVVATDTTNQYTDSDPVAVPAFTVLEAPKPQAPQPTNLKAEPTADGAKISADVKLS